MLLQMVSTLLLVLLRAWLSALSSRLLVFPMIRRALLLCTATTAEPTIRLRRVYRLLYINCEQRVAAQIKCQQRPARVTEQREREWLECLVVEPAVGHA
jgi:hypothetical protein